MSFNVADTICAIATPPGRGGIGIVRISGSLTSQVCLKVLGFQPTPRKAHSSDFLNSDGNIIDNGIAIFYPAPNSYTGEDVLELQGHGGLHVLNTVMACVLDSGVRQAEPGEFSERAFLNNKIDLVQAEAIADLIDASSKQAARSAMRTLQGEFSKRIFELQEQLTTIRVNVEAAIDFSDEDIDVINETLVGSKISKALSELDRIFRQARQGKLLHDGINVVIAGKPNAGKSSLLNALAGDESAIVTDIPGTTRDLLKLEINIDGLPVHLIDTAGIHQSTNLVEREGIRRAMVAIDYADLVLLVTDASLPRQDITKTLEPISHTDKELRINSEVFKKVVIIMNKIDLLEECHAKVTKISNGKDTYPQIALSAKTSAGLDLLRSHLKKSIGFNPSEQGDFAARNRHLKALSSAKEFIQSAYLKVSNRSHLELIADDLRLAQKNLGAITGEFGSDDLLTEIFSSFCIGK
ncbi:MAG: tRNA uridine-5-carboxymethylaminomethyl(34) synthesis GTPase MnmE [Gammaproteobacteria bacterium]|nr:tRNA uridine-5-carboxymethylaminomethyl(34) synthesis GTPase MnmE [Gammaproteobacteria bacterium]